MKKFLFDVEIITDSNVYCVTTFQIATHKIYRGIDIDTLERVLKEIKDSKSDTTINIRGVNY